MCVCSHTRVCLYVSRKRKINFLARAHIASKTDVPVRLCIHVFSDKHLLTLLASAQSLKGNAAWRQTLTHNKRMCQCVCYKKHLLTSLARAHRASGVMLPGGKGSRTTNGCASASATLGRQPGSRCIVRTTKSYFQEKKLVPVKPFLFLVVFSYTHYLANVERF